MKAAAIGRQTAAEDIARSITIEEDAPPKDSPPEETPQ
jgi:hypothetical protein